jgi:hypothetical protein
MGPKVLQLCKISKFGNVESIKKFILNLKLGLSASMNVGNKDSKAA